MSYFKHFFGFFILLAFLLTPGYLFGQTSPRAASSDGDLSTIVVSASRTQEDVREVPVGVTIITEKDINESSATDLFKLLQQKMGLSGVDYGNSQYVTIRGIYATENTQLESRVLILVNGRRTGITEPNQVGLQNIERIEIIRGPSAVQYGASALAGVINIITKRGVPDKIAATVEVGLGSYGLNKESASISGGYGGFDFAFGFSQSDRNSYSVKGDKPYPHTELQKTNFNLSAGYTFLEKHRIGMTYSNTENLSHLPRTGWRDLYENNVLQGLPVPFATYQVNNWNYGITYDGATYDDMFDWSVYFSTGEDKLYAYIGDDRDDLNTYVYQRITNYGGQAGFNSTYFDVDVGIDLLEYKINGLYDGRNVSKDLGIFIASKIKLLNDTLFISLGGRWDKYEYTDKESSANSRSKNNFAPSVGISYLPVSWLKLRANYSEGFRMPTSFNISGGVIGTNTYEPNPNIKPEESKTWEFGFDIDYEFLSSSFTYFHTDWKNKIMSKTISGVYIPPNYYWTGQYINLEQAEIAGIELSFKADLGRAFGWGFELSPYLNYTYLTKMKNKDRTQFLADGSDTLPNTPKWNLVYGLTLNHPDIDLMADINAIHRGPQIFTYAYGKTVPFHDGAHLISVNLAVEKGLFDIGPGGEFGKVKLRAEINNMFDNDNEIYYDYPGAGRNFYVALKYVY
jgi:vitamin B12 transporter